MSPDCSTSAAASRTAVRIPLGVLCGIWLSMVGAVEMPPVTYNGELRLDFRLLDPEEEDASLQQLRTAQLAGASYIWQPWFATVDGNVAFSQSITEAETDSEGLFGTGGASIRVFPTSRFPFETFVNYSDSRSEFDDPLGTQASEFQTLRYGARQDYRPKTGNSSYTANAERVVQTDNIGSEDVTDLFVFSTRQNFVKHRFNVNLSVENSDRDQDQTDTLNTILTGQHTYRPNKTLSIETFANVTDLKQENPTLDTRFTRSDINSFLIWRPKDKPLTVDADARLTATRTETGGRGSNFYAESMRVGATYDVNERLQLSGNVGGTRNHNGSDDLSSFQNATATYRSGTIPLRGFNYDWSTSGSVANNTNSGEEAVQRVSLLAGHGVSRTVTLPRDASLSISLTQNFDTFSDTNIGSEQALNHSGTFNVSRSGANSTSNAALILTDSRTFGVETQSGEQDTSFQTASLQINHFENLSPYSRWSANLNSQVNRIDDGSQTDTFTFSSANLSYEHFRLFGVRRLRYRGDLKLSTESLFFVSEDDEDQPEVSWDNVLEYNIGRLDVRLRGVVVDRGGNTDFTIFLTIRRSFDGRAFVN